MFSDYSGDVGTVYDVPSSSTVVGDVSYIPTPGANGPAPNLGNPDGIGIPAEAKNVSAAVTFIKWYEQAANQAAFAGANGPSEVISGFPLPVKCRWPQCPREVGQGRRCGRAGHPGRAPFAGHLPGRRAAVVPRLQ